MEFCICVEITTPTSNKIITYIYEGQNLVESEIVKLSLKDFENSKVFSTAGVFKRECCGNTFYTYSDNINVCCVDYPRYDVVKPDKVIQIGEQTTCHGCKMNLANQLAHTGPGGCFDDECEF